MFFDPLFNPYPSRRMVVYGRRGMVATSQPLAAQAGIEVLKKGGNAIDAAIAAAACLTVTEPTSNGVGGDLFAIIWAEGRLHGLNASGWAPEGLSIDALEAAGISEIPRFGWVPVTIPGLPAGWAALSERFGRLPLIDCMMPAIQYADEGYPVSPVTSHWWRRAFEIYKRNLRGEEFSYWFKTFAVDGRAPQPGELWRCKDLARTLGSIGQTNAKSFYEGDIADYIDDFSRKYGGYLRKGDLEAYRVEWVEPVNISYRGYDVWELPPNCHGIVALMALNIAKHFDFYEKDNALTLHRQIEAMKLAYADGLKYVADPRAMDVRVEDLLSDTYGLERSRLIGSRAITPEAGSPPSGGTVYLAAADGEGNMVSLIQSNYMGFGSGLVVPGTGIALHNRGCNFTLDRGHCNRLEPGKKPYHTIIPGFLTKNNEPIGPFGVMGAFMQPQGHMQVIMNTIDFHLNPNSPWTHRAGSGSGVYRLKWSLECPLI